MYCPYCGTKFDKSELHTTDQVEYLNRAAKAEAEAYVHDELHKMLKKTFGSTSARKSGLSYKPGSFRKKNVTPNYQERKVKTNKTPIIIPPKKSTPASPPCVVIQPVMTNSR